jgi:hypothetical protein
MREFWVAASAERLAEMYGLEAECLTTSKSAIMIPLFMTSSEDTNIDSDAVTRAYNELEKFRVIQNVAATMGADLPGK